jgi:hypothetical protein
MSCLLNLFDEGNIWIIILVLVFVLFFSNSSTSTGCCNA